MIIDRDRDDSLSLLTTPIAHATLNPEKTLQFSSQTIIKNQAMTCSGMLSFDCIIQRDPNVIAAEAGEDLVMVSIANGLYYGVSDVARDVWEAIERPKKISDLINDLAATYNVDRSSCEQQTLSFLESLLSEGLLQVRDGPPPS